MPIGLSMKALMGAVKEDTGEVVAVNQALESDLPQSVVWSPKIRVITLTEESDLSMDIAQPTALLHESTFTAANGTSIDAYTPDTGSGWTLLENNLEVSNNYIINPTSNTEATAYTDVGQHDVTILQDVYLTNLFSNSIRVGVVTNVVDVDNLWECRIENQGTNMEIIEWSGGGGFIRRSANPNLSEDIWYTATVQIFESGGSWYISFEVNGVSINTETGGTAFPIGTTTNLHGTRIQQVSGVTPRVDNFIVNAA